MQTVVLIIVFLFFSSQVTFGQYSSDLIEIINCSQSSSIDKNSNYYVNINLLKRVTQLSERVNHNKLHKEAIEASYQFELSELLGCIDFIINTHCDYFGEFLENIAYDTNFVMTEKSYIVFPVIQIEQESEESK